MHIPAAVADLEPYVHAGRWHFRKRHNVVRSPGLRAFDICVGTLLRGRRYRGMGPVLDEEAVHEALRRASRECSRRVKGLAQRFV